MLFTQDRLRTRALFVDAWRKHRQSEPLEPLEKQIVSLIEEHPEYHRLLESGEDDLDQDYTGDDGVSNPYLHLGMHLALREQVGTDRPAGIRTVTRALLLKHGEGSGHDVEHRMMECLGVALWDAQRQGRAPDEAAYLESLKRLL